MDITATIPEIEMRLRIVGMSHKELCRQAEIAETTWLRWRKGSNQPNFATWKKVVACVPPLPEEQAIAKV